MRFFNDLKKDIQEINVPKEFELYLYYVRQYTEGLQCEEQLTNSIINLMKHIYKEYHSCKDRECNRNCTSKYDHFVFDRDCLSNCKNSDCAKAFAILSLFYYTQQFSFHNNRVCTWYAEAIAREVKKIDSSKIPESFFCYFNADEYLEKEQKKQVDLERKYLELYRDYIEVRSKLSKYEDKE